MHQQIFRFPLNHFRPLHNPTQFIEALISALSRSKDEMVSPEDFLAYAEKLVDSVKDSDDAGGKKQAAQLLEVARCYQVYQDCLRENDAVDFGDQVFLAVRLLEQHPEI
ncbi:MAG: hypothetical protein IIA67_14180, partial [Planctomycetes bacterium]|nr:hypothetical protein [Planctomycetota bacterium]